MAKNKVQIEVELQDQVSRAYKRVSSNLSASDKKIVSSLKKVKAQSDKTTASASKLGRTITGLAGAFGSLLIINKINSVVSDSIRLFGIQAEAEAKVEQTIIATGQAAGVTTEELKKMASGLQQVTKFGDETILRGQSMLLTFKNIGKDVFPAATETMLNLAEAMGTDVKEQAIQLGKALNDPITGLTALRRVGITFTESQSDTIKTMQKMGDIAGAQKLILAELESQFGGLAQAAAKIGTGPLIQFQNRMGDLQEQIGEKLLPTVLDLAAGFEKWLTPARIDKIIDGFDDWAVGAKEIFKWMSKVGDKAQFLLNLFGNDDLKENWLSDPATAKEIKTKVDQLIELDSEVKRLNKDWKDLSWTQKIAGKVGREVEIERNKTLLEQKKLRDQLGNEIGKNFAEENANLKSLSVTLGNVNKKRVEAVEIEKKKPTPTAPTAPTGSPAEKLKKAEIFGPTREDFDKQHNMIAEQQAKMLEDGRAFELMQLQGAKKLTDEKIALQDKEDQKAKDSAALKKALMIQEGHNFVNNLQTIAQANKKFGTLYKTAAHAQNIVDTYAGATASYKSLAGIPIVGPALGGAAAAAAIGAGLARGAMINAQKFAEGGIVGGNSFSGDRVPAMVNSGEMILNKRQQANLFNQSNGGGGNTINFESPVINVSGNADIGAIQSAVETTYQEQIAKTAEMLNEVQIQEVIA